MAASGCKVVIIYPESEYLDLSKQLGGELITITPSETSAFNLWAGLRMKHNNTNNERR